MLRTRHAGNGHFSHPDKAVVFPWVFVRVTEYNGRLLKAAGVVVVEVEVSYAGEGLDIPGDCPDIFLARG
jgi:hypothetical protein